MQSNLWVSFFAFVFFALVVSTKSYRNSQQRCSQEYMFAMTSFCKGESDRKRSTGHGSGSIWNIPDQYRVKRSTPDGDEDPSPSMQFIGSKLNPPVRIVPDDQHDDGGGVSSGNNSPYDETLEKYPKSQYLGSKYIAGTEVEHPEHSNANAMTDASPYPDFAYHSGSSPLGVYFASLAGEPEKSPWWVQGSRRQRRIGTDGRIAAAYHCCGNLRCYRDIFNRMDLGSMCD